MYFNITQLFYNSQKKNNKPLSRTSIVKNNNNLGLTTNVFKLSIVVNYQLDV